MAVQPERAGLEPRDVEELLDQLAQPPHGGHLFAHGGRRFSEASIQNILQWPLAGRPSYPC